MQRLPGHRFHTFINIIRYIIDRYNHRDIRFIIFFLHTCQQLFAGSLQDFSLFPCKTRFCLCRSGQPVLFGKKLCKPVFFFCNQAGNCFTSGKYSSGQTVQSVNDPIPVINQNRIISIKSFFRNAPCHCSSIHKPFFRCFRTTEQTDCFNIKSGSRPIATTRQLFLQCGVTNRNPSLILLLSLQYPLQRNIHHKRCAGSPRQFQIMGIDPDKIFYSVFL